MIHIPYRQNYLGDRKFPVSRLKYKNSHTRKRKERYEFYIKFKKFKQIRWRKRLLAELREIGNRAN